MHICLDVMKVKIHTAVDRPGRLRHAQPNCAICTCTLYLQKRPGLLWGSVNLNFGEMGSVA